MSYYVCLEHRKAWSGKKQFIGHWQGTHQGQPRPPDEAVMMEEVREGFELAQIRGKRSPPPPPPSSMKQTPTVYGPSLDPNQVIREILKEHPDLPEAAVREVMSWTR